MSDYLVSPSRETPWHMEPDEFAAQLRKDWPEAEVRMLEDSKITTLRFVLRLENGRELDGRFRSDGQVLALDGGHDEAARVAAWFREIVPADQELVFWDPGGHFHVPLARGVTPEQIVVAVESED